MLHRLPVEPGSRGIGHEIRLHERQPAAFALEAVVDFVGHAPALVATGLVARVATPETLLAE
ncbi:hypothetical protein D3C81_2261190 [compost metagenome]